MTHFIAVIWNQTHIFKAFSNWHTADAQEIRNIESRGQSRVCKEVNMMLSHLASGTAFLISPDKKYIGSPEGQDSGVKRQRQEVLPWMVADFKDLTVWDTYQPEPSYQPRLKVERKTLGLSHYNL